MTSSVMANSGKDAYNRYLRDGVGIDIPKPQVVETKPTTVASGSGTDSSSGNTNSGTSSSGYHGDLPAVSHSNPGPASNPFGDRTILIGVSCGSREFQKRHLVRSMQINKYPGYDITWRFVMGRPLDIYRPALEAENKTYGDLIIIERANDTWEEARIYKPFMFFQYVEKNLPEFKWVAKMDTDTFMNLPLFFQDYFNADIRARKNLVVALNWLLPNYRCGFPEGGFYALTWDLLVLLNGYFDTIKPIYPPEDMQFGQYFCEAGHHYDQIDIPLTRAFHWDPKEDDKRKVLHTIYDDSVRIHDLKKEEDYVKVADCYHKDGFNATRVALWKEIGWDVTKMDPSKY